MPLLLCCALTPSPMRPDHAAHPAPPPPAGLLTKKAQEGAQTTMEATLLAQQTPAQRDQMRALQPAASAAWWQPGHPGWAISPTDSEEFLATGTLDGAALPDAKVLLDTVTGV